MQRRTLLRAGLTALAGPTALATATQALAQPQPLIEVWKDPNCGCCQDWMTHLKANGFAVKAHDVGNTAARRRLGLPDRYGSCHTATVGGYVVEGHVPAADIQRLLRERPKALGLSVPRMPIGSPGMDGPEYGGRQDPYDVLLVGRDGNATIYASYHR
ncbi:DUF411 domain-containing protein [Aquabacterium sp. A08]|uniref:DUF411 domain-containing protein n=1 Tax=Aquabacterium sp. A08 TaxID=2718532 RepID=UPI0014223432|nr:DUF411 domain-containing protein [Aquabacterium sp. A08]NIC42549.1 DUF411 domain-containing protein [Aquabacterium sp. A08]